VSNGIRSIIHGLGTDTFPTPTRRSVGLVAAVGVAYFLAARLGLALLAKPESVAVFWPAAGMSAGLMIVLGRSAWPPIAVGVMAATVVANLLGDRNVPLAAVFAVCNAGEAMLTAWFAAQTAGSDAERQDVRRVLGFLFAALIGPAAAALAAAIALKLSGHSTAPLHAIWRAWFAADAVGIVTVAPLLVSLVAAWRVEWPPRLLIEGTAALVVLAVCSITAFSVPLGPLATSLPDILLLPCLLWLAARCRAVFSAAGIVVVSVIVIAMTLLGIGHYGDPAVPLSERVLGAQIVMLAYAIAALSVAALFSERRHAEVKLGQVNARLQLALDAAEQGVWSVDLTTRVLLGDARANLIHGHRPDHNFETLDLARSDIHPDDLSGVDAAFKAARRSGSFFETEYRIADPKAGSESFRWVAAAGRFDVSGNQVHGVVRDITQRKQAEAAQAESEVRLRSILQAANVVAWEVDIKSDHVHSLGPVSELFNKPDDFRMDTQAEFLSCIAETDRDRVLAALQLAFGCGGSYSTEFRVPLADGGVRWIGAEGAPERVSEGQPLRMRGVSFDISKRKLAELALAEALRVTAVACEAGRMGTWYLDVARNRLEYSDDMLALMGIERSQWAATPEALEEFIHPDDIEFRRSQRAHAITGGGDFDFEFRIRRPDGAIRWLHSRGRIIRSTEGTPTEGYGVMIDVTERKHTEARQQVLIAELDHRVKNTLASVGAVVQRTRDEGRSLDEFIETLDGRIYSMAHTHSLLSLSHWEGARLAALVDAELMPYATSSNHSVAGPETVLTADAAQVVATVLHELTTNASKYGALSLSTGHVAVQWYVSGTPGKMLVIDWVESGGPPVTMPDRRGYGTSVICDQIPYELNGRVDFSFAPGGVRCRIELPLDRVVKTFVVN
jgi:PAS domain S-box-containing protein